MSNYTSFFNTGGRNASASFTVSTFGTISLNGAVSTWFNDDDTGNTRWFNSATAGSSGFKIDFGVGVKKIIDGFSFHSSNSTSCGTWRFYGSNDDSSYTALGASFTWQGNTNGTSSNLRKVVSEPNANTTAYRYYKLQFESGSVSSSPFQYDLRFRLCDDGNTVSDNSSFALGMYASKFSNGVSTIGLPSFSTNSVDDILVVMLYNEKSGTPGKISSIASTNLTSGNWHKHTQQAHTDAGNSHQHNIDIWWYKLTSVLTNEADLVVTLDATTDDFTCTMFTVMGCDTTTPFDANGSIPAVASNDNTTATTPTVTGVSTTNADTILIGIVGNSTGGMGSETPGSGYTKLDYQLNGGGSNWAYSLSQFKKVTAAQSSVSVATVGTTKDWLMVATAIQKVAAAAPTGTWASTEAADTFAGAGGTLSGTWASTEAKDTFAGAGGLLGGSWASTEARDTFAGIGAPQANATMAVTEAADAFAGAGYPQMIGSWASTEAADVFAAFAVEQVRGSMYLSEVKDTFAGVGLSTIQATMTAHEAADTLAVAGYPALFGTFTPTEAKDTLTVVADPGFGIEAHATGNAHDTNTCNVSLTTVYDDALMVLAIYTGGFWNHANVSTVSDSTGQTWHKRNVRHHSGGKQDFELWWAKKHTAGATTITVTTTGTTGFICLEALGIHRANLNKPWDTHTGAGSGVDNWGSGNPKGTLYSNATDTLALAWYQSNDGASTGDVSHLQNGAFSSPTVNPASWTWLERVTANETNGFSGRLESAYGRFHSQLSPVQVQFGGSFGARNVLVMQDVLVAADDPNVATVATDDIIRWHFDGHGQQVVVQLDPSTTDVTLTSFQTYEADTIAVAAIMIQSPTQGRVESITDTADFSPGWTRRSIVTTPDGKLSLEIWWCHFTTAYSNGNLVVHCDSNTHTGDIVGVVAWGINGPSEFLRGVIWDGDSSLPATAESIIASNQTVGPFNTLNANVLEINVAANIGSGGIDGTGGLEGLNQLPWLQFLGDFFGSPAGLLDSGAPPFNVALDFKFSAPAVSAESVEVDLTSPRPDKWLMIADALPVGPPSPPEGRWASTDAKDRATHAGDFTSIGIASPGGWVGYVPATATMAATDHKDLPTNSGAFTAIWNTSGWIGFVPAFTDNVNWLESKDVMHSGVWVLGPETILAFFEATEAKDRISTNRLFTSYTTADSIGNRTSRITAATNASIDSGTVSNLVDGSKTNGPSHALSVTNSQPAAMYFSFDFGTARIINEAKWYQNGSFAQPGLWKWQGSSNGTTWTDLSTTFTLDGGNGGSVIGNLSANITAYRYYRILQTTNAGGSDIPWLWEIEFKVEGIGGTLAITEFKDRANYQVRVVPKVDPPPPRKRRALIVT